MHVIARKYKDQDAFYASNKADIDPSLDSLEGAPAIFAELREASNEIVLRRARSPETSVVKVTPGLEPPTTCVMGYATFIDQIRGCTLEMLEQRLGMRGGVLQKDGAYVYTVDGLRLNQKNIVPRGSTDWPAGISPRALFILQQETGLLVEHNRDYPQAKVPIVQFRIIEEVPVIGKPRLITGNGVV